MPPQVTVSGLLVPPPDRHEIAQALHWDDSSGSDLHFKPDAAGISGTGNAEDLSDVGWTITGFTFVEGLGGDFLSLAGLGVPAHYLLDAAGDLLQSPRIFGNYTHGDQASHHVGKQPAMLTMEMWAAFADASNDEEESGFGFVQAGGAINVAANALAIIRSDGTNFELRSSVDSDVGALIDNAWHLWKIVISKGTTDAIEWFIDGVSQGTIDLLEDVFPLIWGAGILAATGANDILAGESRLFYR